jgi:hypothetical protein
MQSTLRPLSTLPEPAPEALAASRALAREIEGAIVAAGGAIDFSRYMELALYAPGLGYYTGGARKFGADGDFTTAPELTPLFGQTLARTLAPVLREPGSELVELGAVVGDRRAAPPHREAGTHDRRQADLVEQLLRALDVGHGLAAADPQADLVHRRLEPLAAFGLVDLDGIGHTVLRLRHRRMPRKIGPSPAPCRRSRSSRICPKTPSLRSSKSARCSASTKASSSSSRATKPTPST